MTHREVFFHAVEALQDRRSLEIVGAYGSGRTHLISRVREHFASLGWTAIEVTGIDGLRKSPLVALYIAGLTGPGDNRLPAIVAAYEALKAKAEHGRALLLIDDCDSLDEASWGVLSAISSQLSVPMLLTRLPHTAHSPVVNTTSGFSPIYSLDLPPMTYPELEAVLESSTGMTFDPSTMSRIFAKSGGNFGLAEAIVDAGRRAGVIESGVDGVLRAPASLWTPALRTLTNIILRGVSDADIATLKTLALLGPADLETALKVVKRDRLAALEGRGLASLVSAGTRIVVTVSPPLLGEHFRHDVPSAERVHILERIDDALEDGEHRAESATNLSDTATFVRLTHESARARTIRAREGWRTRSTLASATVLLIALNADISYPMEEIDSLVESVRTMAGTDQERGDWAVAYGAHLASHRGQPAAAVASLRNAAAAMPSESTRLNAYATELEIAFGEIPSTLPFEDVDISRLERTDQTAVLRTQTFWFLVRGQVARARATLEPHTDTFDREDPRFDALQIYIELADRNPGAALALARRGLDAARSDFDAPKIRVYAFLVALSAFIVRDQIEAAAAVDDALALGVQPGESPMSYIGLTLLGAYFAGERGQRAAANQHLADLDASRLPDGPLPFQQRGFVHMRLAVGERDLVNAGRIAVELGDELWERGALLAAATMYLDGLRFAPSEDVWKHVKPRVDSVDSDAIRKAARFTSALVDRDPGELLASVQDTALQFSSAEAAHSAHLALTALATRQTGSTVDGVMRELTQIAGGRQNRYLAGVAYGELTNREQEVMQLIAAGLSNPQIAEVLVVSTRTVESHVNRLMKKLGTNDRRKIRDAFHDWMRSIP